MNDLFSLPTTDKTAKNSMEKTEPNQVTVSDTKQEAYSAKDIEVLEGLEPVRKRPGMYIGGTDERAYHHLVAEILDNSMDEAVAGHASRINVHVKADGSVSVEDNGRGIPVDPHPKYKDKSALEVIMTTLHSGGKFSGKAYQTSGGLHGVGISVVNALTEQLTVDVWRGQTHYTQSFSRGAPTNKLQNVGKVHNKRGTRVNFLPDTQIFGTEIKFRPKTLYELTKSKAYLTRGVEIHWSCDKQLIASGSEVPEQEVFHFPNGIVDYLDLVLKNRSLLVESKFGGLVEFPQGKGKVEWALAWNDGGDAMMQTFVNTIPTPNGGSHESGLRTALLRSFKQYGELAGIKKASIITSDDIVGQASIVLSTFIRDPQFQGQTKERLSTPEAAKLVDVVIKEQFDHWLAGNGKDAKEVIESLVAKAEDRLRRRQEKDMTRKQAGRKLRLPGKLADCSSKSRKGTEIFIVEGDSAGGSAKQARSRELQAILPLRGKILNVASATADKLRANQELSDLTLALGCGRGKNFNIDDLRYERVIIMTDADVDGAHIAALLMTFFYREMRGLIEHGKLYLGMPPLYRVQQGAKTFYAKDEAHRDAIIKREFREGAKVDISRFKGLGEMSPKQLKETSMDPKTRSMQLVVVPPKVKAVESEEVLIDTAPVSEQEPIEMMAKNDIGFTELRVEDLMGKKAEPRFRFIQDNAKFATSLDI